MKKYWLNIVKATAVMFTVGAVLAFAAPHIAVAVGLVETASAAASVIGASTVNPLWLGSFFGAFGAVSTAATPAVNWAVDKVASVFSKKSTKQEPEAEFAHASFAIQHPEPEMTQQTTKFREMISQQRCGSELAR